jgi:group II intron reverse transcriptase/maturase
MKRQQSAAQARRYPKMVVNNVFHLSDCDFLRAAYRRTRQDSAPGVDQGTARQYAEHLEGTLRDLQERRRAKRYGAPPLERVGREKAGGRKRPIGPPGFEDKIVQRAMVLLVEAICASALPAFSHGLRRGHRAHQALHARREQCHKWHSKWIVDAEGRGFFDTIDSSRLRELITQRVNEGGMLRRSGRWLNAGVREAGERSSPDKGTPQGGVASPLLANVFLHSVLDEWCVKEVPPRRKGRCCLTRCADDFLLGCESRAEAPRGLAVLPKRFGRFNRTIHAEKTAVMWVNKPLRREHAAAGKGTCDFLGCPHYWAKTRRGYWVIKRKTVGKRLRRVMKGIGTGWREHRHAPLTERQRTRCATLRGYYHSHGIRGNIKALRAVREQTRRAWRYWRSRRSHKSRLTWHKYEASVRQQFPLPKPRIMHHL